VVLRNHIETNRYVTPWGSLSAFLAFSLVFLVFGLSGCGDTSANSKAGEAAPSPSDKTLYVTNGNGGKLLAFDLRVLDQTLTVKGENIPPTRQFPGIVSSPAGLFLDRLNDTLYVANPGQNAIQIYENASTLTAPLTATRTISGNLTHLDQPFGITFDATSGRLFVVNKNGNTIVAFCIGAGLGGNIAPCNLLVGDLTQLDTPRALAVDPQNKILYISNMGNDSILVYRNSDTIGATASQCVSDFSACNIAPSAVISPHAGSETVSKLELPFGVFIDRQNDRLYVANTGLNSPAVLIYENASTLLTGSPMPDRVLTGLNTQLTVPAGIDVDEANGRLSVLNNNSPNNVNTSSGGNTDSPSLLIFNDIDNTCTTHLCNLVPDRRVGGDISAKTPSGTTLTHPVGIVFDPLRDITYVANTGENNIVIYSVEGDLPPVKENFGTNTRLDVPSSFFYDFALDRLYVTNASTIPSGTPFMVYDQVSDLDFGNTPPSWKLAGSSNFERPMGIYIDKTENLMLFLNGVSGVQFGLYVYDLTTGFRESPSLASINFPVNNAIGPTGKTLLPPVQKSKSTDGLSSGGPTSLAVDESRSQVYVADKNNSVVVYEYIDKSVNPPVVMLTKLRTITGFNKPSGLFLDTTRDILYVSNNGEDPAATADYRANTVFVFEGASTKGDGTTDCPSTPCPPNRIISTIGLTAGVQNKLKAPISPYVDVTADRLYLINSASDQNAVFSFNNASTIGDSSASCIAGSANCADTLPTKVIIGPQTKLNFSKTGALFTGAAVLSRHSNNETLYVATSCANSPTCSQGGLFVFGSEGQLEPSKVWTGGGGSFSTPEAVAVDSGKDLLYVANQSTNTLSRLTGASQLSTVTDPSAVKIDLTNIQLNRPAGLFVDASNDRLYVSNSESFACGAGPCNAILVFDGASTLSDGSVPTRSLTDPALSQPQGLALHPTEHRLYVANSSGNTVLIYNQADVLNGAVAANVSLGGFSQPLDVALDAGKNLLYILNRGNKEILVFENASGLTGSESPDRVISSDDGAGNNALVNPSAIFLDADNDLLYLADPGANAVSVFTNASKANGQDNAPKKTFLGDQTGLQSPSALTVVTAP